MRIPGRAHNPLRLLTRGFATRMQRGRERDGIPPAQGAAPGGGRHPGRRHAGCRDRVGLRPAAARTGHGSRARPPARPGPARTTPSAAANALLMAVWRRKPAGPVMVHSDQGSQRISKSWCDFLAAPRLGPSMSRRGNCHGDAAAKSFCQLLKRQRIKHKTDVTPGNAWQDVFDYIEMFCNPKRRHGCNNRLSPAAFERRYFEPSWVPDSLVAIHQAKS